jgi:hypothetical protein
VKEHAIPVDVARGVRYGTVQNQAKSLSVRAHQTSCCGVCQIAVVMTLNNCSIVVLLGVQMPLDMICETSEGQQKFIEEICAS